MLEAFHYKAADRRERSLLTFSAAPAISVLDATKIGACPICVARCTHCGGWWAID